MPKVGIKKYSYKPHTGDYDAFLKVLDDLLKFWRKSDYFRICNYGNLITYLGGKMWYKQSWLKEEQPVGLAEWYLHKYTTLQSLLNEFGIEADVPVDIYIRPKQILLRKFHKTLHDPVEALYSSVKKPFYYPGCDNLIVPITEKEYHKLSKLQQPFTFQLNFIKH